MEADEEHLRDFEGPEGLHRTALRPTGVDLLPAITVVPDDLTVAECTAAFGPDFKRIWAPGVPASGDQGTSGAGDSGGPVLVGAPAGYTMRGGLTPTPLPPPQSNGATYSVGTLHVAGISGAPDADFGGSPAASFAPTYRLGTSLWLAASLQDTDLDGTPNFADACPNDALLAVAAPENDGDGDGRPDACDPFPGDITNDADKDGVGFPQDACAFTKQATFGNTNFEFEEAQRAQQPGLLTLADACDPVPSPKHRPLFAASTGAGGLPAFYGFVGGFELRPRAAHYALLPQPPANGQSSPVVGSEASTRVAVANVPTHFRFCDDANQVNVVCDDISILRDESLLRVAEAVASEPASAPYRRMAVGQGANPWDVSVPLLYDDVSTAFVRWQWTSDLSRLREAGYIASGSTTLSGRTWFHNTSTFGGTTPLPLPPTAPPASEPFGAHGLGLASALGSVDTAAKLKSPPAPLPWFVVPTLPSPTPPPSGPKVWWRQCATCASPLLDRPPSESVLLAHVDGVGPLALHPDGRGESLLSSVGPSLRASLADPSLHWAQGAEPSFEIGTSTAPISLALSADGTRVVERVVADAGALLGLGDVERGGEEGAIPVAQARVAPVRPPPASAFAVVWSRYERRLFRVGGIGPSGEPSHSVWVFDPATDRWGELTFVGWSPERVLASTFSFQDRALYVLDEKPLWGLIVKRRLSRVDLTTGAATELGAWPSLRKHGAFWLSVDRGGDGLILAASSRRVPGAHVVVRFALADGALTPTGVHTGSHPLAGGVWVDETGYTVVVGQNGRQVPQRATELRDLPGSWVGTGAVDAFACLR